MLTFHNQPDVHEHVKKDETNDFTLVCSDEIEISINKEAFSKKSPVFKAMFQTNMIERKQNLSKIVDVDSITMTQVIDFIYTGSAANWSVEMASKLLYVAEKYEIIRLKFASHNLLMKNIDFSNVFEILKVADFYNLKLLEGKCLTFIVT